VTRILGISAFYHDSAATLLEDGRIVAALQEERFTRKKHDASFPRRAVETCLRIGDCRTKDLDYVVFYEKTFPKFERLLETYLDRWPKGIRSYLKAIPLWVKDKLWMKENLRRELDYEGPILFAEHHESHAASAFYPSPFRRAAIYTVDGVGEWTTTALGRGSGGDFELLKEIRFPHSLGLLYSTFTYFLGFRVNSAEYKVMGLAPYGRPRFADRIREEIVHVDEDGAFRLNLRYFDFETGLTMASNAFSDLWGRPPRRPGEPLDAFHKDLAASIQQVTEEVVLRTTRHLHRLTGEENLCMAGGVALNCVANGRILRESPFLRLWVQPASGDAGGSLAPRWRPGIDFSAGSACATTTTAATDKAHRCWVPNTTTGASRNCCEADRPSSTGSPTGSCSTMPRGGSTGAPWWVGFKVGWNSGPGPWAIAASWPTRGAPGCWTRSTVASNIGSPSGPSPPPCWRRGSESISNSTAPVPTCCWWLPSPRWARRYSGRHPRRRLGPRPDGRAGRQSEVPPIARHLRWTDGLPRSPQYELQRPG
jgi:hypothetical protein